MYIVTVVCRRAPRYKLLKEKKIIIDDLRASCIALQTGLCV